MSVHEQDNVRRTCWAVELWDNKTWVEDSANQNWSSISTLDSSTAPSQLHIWLALQAEAEQNCFFMPKTWSNDAVLFGTDVELGVVGYTH